jgi:ATP-dependent DNA helicase RecG
MWAIGDRSAAVAHLERAFEQQPHSGILASQIIDYALAMDDLSLARKVLDRFHKEPIKRESSQPYLVFARNLLDRNEVSEARRILGMIPLTSTDDEIFEAAVLRKRAGEYKEAHRLLAQVYPRLMNDPKVVQEFAQTKLRLARELHGGKDYPTKKRLNQESVELLHRAIQLATDPVREAWCWYDLARTLAWLREPSSDVEAAFLRAITLRADEPRFKKAYDEWRNVSRSRPRRFR